MTFTLLKYDNFWFKHFWISAVLHFVSYCVGWGETKLSRFSLTLLFAALTILRYDLYQFMTVILRYVWTFKIVYIILKPISFWIYFKIWFQFWNIGGFFFSCCSLVSITLFVTFSRNGWFPFLIIVAFFWTIWICLVGPGGRPKNT